jgi:hypothetical protein
LNETIVNKKQKINFALGDYRMEKLSKDYQNIILKIALIVLKNDALRVLVADMINIPNYVIGNLLFELKKIDKI